ncbi:hypothetical protein [Sporolactobacillus spathodeae]|uniref:DUF2892 domain-containing protein n=1 Tax=Sporolactobacillus spathodeae TaxID=1465502 RepID=A0ABS2Q995_9BACL|nr:hypothetical protein [Sporolactobacillus spathodeae]MBM7658231.1 hypothetical protein [Sporolactobacillus spathodeae]
MEQFKLIVRMIIAIGSISLFLFSIFFNWLPLTTVLAIIPSVCLLYIILFQNPPPAKPAQKDKKE